MGGAFHQALQQSYPDLRCLVYDPDGEKTGHLKTGVCSSPRETAEASDLAILAVKPQLLPEVCSQLPEGRYISLAAGVELADLHRMLPSSQVVRFMPTIAALACASPVAVCWDQQAPPSWRDDAVAIADAAGKAVVMPETQISGFIGVAGSGIAYMFQFLHAAALGGTKAGLSYQQSLDTAVQTMKAAAAVIETTGKHPAEAVTMVTSPGGTTIEGIHALEAGGFTSAVIDAVTAAAEKSEKMSKG